MSESTSSGRNRRSGSRNTGTWTLANTLTTVRVVLIPAWMGIAQLAVPSHGEGFSFSSLLVALLYIGIAATDKLDGEIARKRNEITVFGQFLDPIADKLIVVIAFTYLLQQGVISPWVIVIVVFREFLVSGIRMVVAEKGVVIAASNIGKAKTATTLGAIIGLLIYLALPAGVFADILLKACNICVIVAMLLTIYSGADYLWKSREYLFAAE